MSKFFAIIVTLMLVSFAGNAFAWSCYAEAYFEKNEWQPAGYHHMEDGDNNPGYDYIQYSLYIDTSGSGYGDNFVGYGTTWIEQHYDCNIRDTMYLPNEGEYVEVGALAGCGSGAGASYVYAGFDWGGK